MSLCYDIEKCGWSEELSDVMNISLNRLLPPVRGADEILGEVTTRAASQTGLAAGTPVMVSSVDSALALLEVGISRQGDAAEITGTSSNTFFAAKDKTPSTSPLSWIKPLVTTREVPHLIFAPTNTTGEAFRWARELTGLSDEMSPDGYSMYRYIDEKINQVTHSGLLFYPYLSGERAPLWSNAMRGMLIGAGLRTTRWDMLRAVYEGTSFAQKELCEEAKKAGAALERFRITGGCAKSDTWVKIKASVLEMPVDVVADGGGAAKGNALLGGYGTGIYKDMLAVTGEMLRITKTVEPDRMLAEKYRELYPVFLSVRNHISDDLEQLARVSDQ